MKVLNRDIWQAQDSLQELCKEPWPVKTAYRLAKLARKVGEHHRDIEQVRNALIQRHGSLNEQGQPFVAQGAAGWTDFVAAFNELMSEEAEIDWGSVALPTTDGFRVTPATLLPLEPFITIEEDA